MSQRRPIACTICAKAKTKCDKAVPSCSRCTAKGLVCEPRSTRRTSDSNYRSTKKHAVSPKRFPSTNSIPTIGRHPSPRSNPSQRHQLVRAVSQMDFHTAVKMGHRMPDFAAMSMLTPLQTYTPQIIDDCFPYSAGSDTNTAHFTPHTVEKPYGQPGGLTPRTPESFSYGGPLPVSDTFEQYANSQGWPQQKEMPIGLGFEGDIPGLMPTDTGMRLWTPEYTVQPALMPPMHSFNSAVCDSPGTTTIWPSSTISVSPSQPPHSRGVPSLSLSECSVQESESPHGTQHEWPCLQETQHGIPNSTPITSTSYLDSIKSLPLVPQEWDGIATPPRSSTF